MSHRILTVSEPLCEGAFGGELVVPQKSVVSACRQQELRAWSQKSSPSEWRTEKASPKAHILVGLSHIHSVLLF